MSDKILYIRHYDQDLYPEYSGIALGDKSGDWKIITNKFSSEKLAALTKKHTQAQLQNFPLPDINHQ